MTVRKLFSPLAADIADEIESIVDNFDNVGKVIYRGHNLIKVVRLSDGTLINIKRYCIPHLINRVIYSFIRKPKGLRAFIYPERLINVGIDTPEPLAYIELRKKLLISHSFLITRQIGLHRDLYEFGDKPIDNDNDRKILADLASYTAKMHTNGILHRDFSPGNILFDTTPDGSTVFSVVDINRMSFGKVSVREGVENMARLWGQPVMFDILADEYARQRGADPVKCRRWLKEARRRFWTRFSQRHKVKYNLILD